MTSPVKVLHFVEATGGGVLSVILDSIRELQDSSCGKFEFTVLYSAREETPKGLETLLSGVSFHRMLIGRRFFSLTDMLVVLRVARFAGRFDVLHCHSSRAGFIGRLSRMFNGRMRILYSPHCYAFLNKEFSTWKRCLVVAVEWLLARTPGAATVACGDSEYAIARRLGGRVVLVRNGCDAMPAAIETERCLVVGSGRDCLQKDPDLFLEIVRRSSPLGIDFRWVGPLRELPFATGWVSRDEASRTIATGGIFVITSLWEGMAVAGLEALAAGLPIIARNTPGTRDLVEHGINGFVFDTADQAVSFLSELATNDGLRSRMGCYSRQRYEALFTRQNYRSLAELYVSGVA